MGREFGSRHRYLILPASGISDAAMQSGIFDRNASAASRSAQLRKNYSFGLRRAEGGDAFEAAGEQADSGVSIRDDDFEVISQRFEDGPALVRMTSAARMALVASQPGLRVLPVTTYFLPGCNPRRRNKADIAARLAGVDAVGADGVLFPSDAKRHYLEKVEDAGHQSGLGVTVGVIDTGIDATHAALSPNVLMTRSTVPGEDPTTGRPVDWGPAFRDEAGHGTHVAGIISAAGGHGGPAGVAPKARIIGYRVFPDTANGMRGAENPSIIDAIRFAVDDGCHVVNLSLEGPSLKEDGVRTAISDAWNNGVVCIAAAGNGFGNPVSYPAALPQCVAVTAIGRDGEYPNNLQFTRHVTDQRSALDPAVFLASFSNFGPQVKFTAPGHAIISAFPDNRWWIQSGTSMAAPFVTGILARLLSGNSNVLNMMGNAQRSAAMLQMLIGQARRLLLPQMPQEGFGLPV